MKVARQVAHVAQQDEQSNKRRHHEVSVYKEPGSEFYYYRVKLHGKRYKRSTNQTTLALALKQAKMIRAELLEGKQRETMKRPGFATVGDVLEVWMARSKAKTRGNNRSMLRKWVRSFASGDPDQVSMTRLTAEEFERYVEQWAGSPLGRESTWRQIRAVFADQPMRWYRQAGLVLPDLAEFRLVRAKAKAREQFYEGFTPIAPEVLSRMDRLADRLGRSSNVELRRIWATYALMRQCGLRNVEVEALQWDWLVDGQRGKLWKLELAAVPKAAQALMREELCEQGYYTPKGRPGRVPVRTELVERLRAAFPESELFVVPRRTATDAHELTHRTINKLVRKFVPRETSDRAAYLLRGQFGAELSLRDGIEVACRVLRHADIKTTWRHYHALLNEPAPL